MQISRNSNKKPEPHLIKSILSTFSLRLISTGLAFVINVFLARLLGLDEFGKYTLVFTWVSLLSLFTTVGLENLMVRQVALYKSQELWGLLRGLLRRADHIVLCTSSGVALLVVAISWRTTNTSLFLVFCVGMLGLPPSSLSNLRRGAMDGLSKVALGFLTETVIAPVLFILFTIVAVGSFGLKLSAISVIGIYSLITLLTFVISSIILRQTLPRFDLEILTEYHTKAWIKSAVPFLFLGSLYAISTRIDILMLGAIQGSDVVGIYNPVNRGAQLLTFIPAAIGRVLAPKIAQAYASGEIKKLKKLMADSAKGILIVSCPVVIVFISLSHWYLSIFGQEFIVGQYALIILCIGQLLKAFTGLPDILLNMTGYESHTAFVAGVGIIINTILNALLIPHWGVEGAATATSISLVLVSVVDVVTVRRKLKLDPSIFSIGSVNILH